MVPKIIFRCTLVHHEVVGGTLSKIAPWFVLRWEAQKWSRGVSSHFGCWGKLFWKFCYLTGKSPYWKTVTAVTLKLATLLVKRMVNFYPCIISTRRQKSLEAWRKKNIYFWEILITPIDSYCTRLSKTGLGLIRGYLVCM